MDISLCLITKNEEKHILRCIKSLEGVVDEIIVVDTGSNDRTKEIAICQSAKVYDFQWINDFSAARNYAMSKCKGKWIIFLDADEYFSEESRKILKKQIFEAERNNKNIILCEMINVDSDTKELISSVTHFRIFKNNGTFVYKGKIHECLNVVKGSFDIYDCADKIKLFHVGYTKSIVLEKDKSNRNIKMLEQDIRENKPSALKMFYLVESLLLDNRYDEALLQCQEVFKYKDEDKQIYVRTYLHWLTLLSLKKDEKLIHKVYDKAVKFSKEYPDFDVIYGSYFAGMNNYEKAIYHYELGIFKMNNYILSYESASVTNAKKVYMALANIYIRLNYEKKAISTLVEILRVYKEDVDILVKILKILVKYENVDDIFSFLNNLYDFDNDLEKLIILKACVKSQNKDLCKYIIQNN